jgi:hypothetical protein
MSHASTRKLAELGFQVTLPIEWSHHGFILKIGRFRQSHDLIMISVSFGDEAIVSGATTGERTITQFRPRVLAV